MTLSSRVSAFFLFAMALMLAIVVAGLSLTARHYLERQLERQLTAGVHSLVGAVEVEIHELEWDPAEHLIALGREAAADRVDWIIRDETGVIVDRSAAIPDDVMTLLSSDSPQTIPPSRSTENAKIQPVGDWLVMHQRVTAEDPTQIPMGEVVEPFDYTELTFSGAVSRQPMEEDLRWLLWTSLLLAGVVWCTAALLGRWYCRRAIAPLVDMASSVRGMQGQIEQQQLEVPATADEVESLGIAFNGLLSRWQQVYERQASFSASVAHQLRTPLTVLLGELELARRRPRSQAELQDVVNQAYVAASQLKRTVEGLLFLTRSDVEQTLPDAVALDLSSWLPAWVNTQRGQQPGAVITGPRPSAGDVPVAKAESVAEAEPIVKAEPAAARVVVQANEVLLSQLLQNLLDNAVQYSASGSEVKVAMTASPKTVTISVQDHGVGISSADLPQIFKPFYRSRAVRQGRPSGIGIGLSLASRIADLHGGTLTVQSIAGAGSTFALTLPRLAAAEQASRQQVKPEQSPGEFAPGHQVQAGRTGD